MKRFISILLIGSLFMSFSFSSYKKVPKNQIKEYRLEPAPLEDVHHSGDAMPIVFPNTRNSGVAALVDSSTNGYGMVAQNTRPLFVDLDNGNMFTVYRQFAGLLTTHGQIGAAFSDDLNNESNWDTYTNLNYNGAPPWGGGGVGGTGVAQGRYPSALGTEDQPLGIWNEYTGDTSTGSLYGGRPYYAYDEFGWDGGSFSYPTDIDLLWQTDSKDLWVGSAAISQDAGMYVVNVVYNDWTRGDRYLFHSEAYEDGYVVFGEEQLVIDEVNDLVGGDDTGSFNTSPYVSFTPDGLGIVGLVGLFLGADADASSVSNYHTGIFKLSDNHGASWYGGSSGDPSLGHANSTDGDGYYFIPDAVWDDLVNTQFGGEVIEDECEGTFHTLDSFWSYYEDDIKVDSEGNPHFAIQVLPCESIEEGFCWYTEQAGLYHFTIDRDHIDNPGPVNTETGWNWSFIMRGDATWSFSDLSGDTYIWNNSTSLAFSKDDADVVYVVTNMAEAGSPTDPAVFEDPCYVTTRSDYPEWSEEIFVIKSEDGGQTWWNPYNWSNTPDNTGGVCPNGYPTCDPAETYPHTAQWGTDDDVYFVYQMPNWAFNEIGDLLGADHMNRVYVGKATIDDSNIDEYSFDDGANSCYAEPGDVSGDSIINVLDIVALVNHILGLSTLEDLCAADYSGDTVVNVLDIVGLVNLILGIGSNHSAVVVDIATYAALKLTDDQLNVESDGCVQGMQVVFEHDSDFSIELKEDYYISKTNLIDASHTVALIVAEKGRCIDEVGTIEGSFNIEEQVFSNSDYNQPINGGAELINANVDFKVKVIGANPFNPSTTLNVVVPIAGHVSVKIYNVVGQEVATLADGVMAENFTGYKLNWNASDLSSGVYFVRAESAGHVSFEKLMLLK